MTKMWCSCSRLLFFHDSEQGTSMQQELRLASADTARVDWLAGLSWYANNYERGNSGQRPMFGPDGPAAFSPLWQATLGIPLALPGQLGIHDSSMDTEYYSAFAQVSWPLGERLTLISAARWQTETKNGSINNSVTLPGRSVVSVLLAPATTPTGAPVNGTLHRSTDYFTWSVTPQFHISDEISAWLTLARGGKSGGFNTGFGNLPLTGREFADESIDHLEMGARAR
jgi:outer membrane receptor protein involved in Fe transport